MARRDPVRTQKLRIAVRYLLERECLAKGNQSRLAEHFKVSRQRVHQIVVEERLRYQQQAGANGDQTMFSQQSATVAVS